MMKWVLAPLDDDVVQEKPQHEGRELETRNDVIVIGGLLPHPDIKCITDKSAVLSFKALPDNCTKVAVCLRNRTTGEQCSSTA